MKKLIAILMTLVFVLCLAACGDRPRTQEELISDANDAADQLLEYKSVLDKQLAAINSADGSEEFFVHADAVGIEFQLR